MAAIGRVLQVIGWLWFIAGFVGPMFGFESLNLFPGLVLIFIARMFRTRARGEMPPGPGEQETRPEPQPVETLRPQPREQPPPQPAPKPSAPSQSSEARSETKAEPEYVRPVEERNQLLERIALAGSEAADEQATTQSGKPSAASKKGAKPAEEARAPMSSAEMIAEARKRWDRNKR
jgi:hypothetical protein